MALGRFNKRAAFTTFFRNFRLFSYSFMQPLAISQECLYFHKKFGCIYALTSYFCPVCIVRCISSCHILFHFFKEGHWGVFHP